VRHWDEGSPYANTRPEVRYLGDEACAACHAQIAQTYSRHPMGRSLSPVATAGPKAGDDERGQPLFTAGGLEYSIERRDGRLFHQETRSDSAGRLVARNEAEVEFVIGSGSQGVGYLIEREGYLFQSPISWYVERRRWDLSPGYEKQNPHFDRPVVSTCLYCHANRVKPVAGRLNRYEKPIFRGQAIGCERCHGPGELHAGRPELVDGRDITIVNPANLDPPLREAVCEQCHLMGQRRVVKLDRQDDDFRPGLPFQRFWTVLEPSSGPAADRFVGQVEQMHESRCFRASEGRLGCISCHDPHRQPEPEQRVSYYRARCLACHANSGCRLAETIRLARSPGDDCASCHMPRSESADIRHAANTNHRIPRGAGDAEPLPSVTVPAPSDEEPLVPFHRAPKEESERAAIERDLGIALSRSGAKGATAALPRLDASLAARPDDAAAWEAKGYALAQLGRPEEGLAALRMALAGGREQESAVTAAAELAAKAGRHDDAIAYWRRAVAIDPWRSDYRAELASLLFQNRDWRAAASACREALRLNPLDISARKLLVRSFLRLGDSAAARRELQDLIDLNPPDRDELMRWLVPLRTP
jgi:predicted CXXCH cytochrome family protein